MLSDSRALKRCGTGDGSGRDPGFKHEEPDSFLE
jgi:hypothetical protein